MNKLCRREIFYNKIFLVVFSIINLLYISVHLLSTKVFENAIWRIENSYIVLIGLSIPILLYGRYGDNNRQIIQNVVYTKLQKKQKIAYQGLYFFWFLFGVVVIGSVAQVLCAFTSNFSLRRGALFLFNVMLVVMIYISLFLVMIELVHTYIWALIAYLVGFFVLILLHAPFSVLWFLNEEGNIMMRIMDKLIWIMGLLLLDKLTSMFKQVKGKRMIKKN